MSANSTYVETTVAVPEPSFLVLLGAAIVGLLLLATVGCSKSSRARRARAFLAISGLHTVTGRSAISRSKPPASDTNLL